MKKWTTFVSTESTLKLEIVYWDNCKGNYIKNYTEIQIYIKILTALKIYLYFISLKISTFGDRDGQKYFSSPTFTWKRISVNWNSDWIKNRGPISIKSN